jgi:DNA-binding IclR family transcriptional regulator
VVDAAPPDEAVVKSAARALQILELFDELRRDAKVSEISERLQYPQSSTSALLKSLTFLGYLNYDKYRRTYIPSTRVAMLGAWLDDRPIRDGTFIRMLERIWQESSQTIIVASRNGIYAQFIHVLQATTPPRFYVPRGSRRYLCNSATGLMLIADLPEQEIRALVHRTNVENHRGAALAARDVLGRAREASTDGYYFSRGLVTSGAGSIAMRLPANLDSSGRPLAVAMSGPLEHLIENENRYVEMMRGAIVSYLQQDAAGDRLERSA